MKKLWGQIGRFFDSVAGSRVALIGSIGVFLALTITRLTASSIWFDEAFGAYLVKFNLVDIVSYTAQDVHPPLYYFALKLWTSLFGTSAVAFRSLSIVFGVLTIILLFILIKKLFNRRTAALSVFLLAVSPLFVRYGIEARMYTMVTTIALAAILAFWRTLQDNRWRDYIIYGLLITAGMYTHYFTIVIWLSLWLVRLVYLWLQPLRGRKLARSFFSVKWLAAHALAIVLFLPWVPTVLHQLGGISSGFWITSITANTPVDFLTELLYYTESKVTADWLAVVMWLVVVLVVILAVRYYRQLVDKSAKQSFWLVAILAIGPAVLLMLLSLPPFHPSFVDRYVLISVVFLSTLLAVLLANTSRQHSQSTSWIKVALVLLLAYSCRYGLGQVYRLGNYNKTNVASIMTGEVMAQIQASDQHDTPIISTSPYGYYEANFYDSATHPTYYLWRDVADSQIGSLAMLKDNRFGRAVRDVNQFMDEHDQVWVIGTSDQSAIAAPFGANHWQPVRTITVTDPVTGSQQNKATLYKKKL